MSETDTFENKFRDLLQEIPKEYTLAQTQFLYRTVIVSMGLKILTHFERDVVGPYTFSPGGGGGGGNTGTTRENADSKGGGESGGGEPAVMIAALTLAINDVHAKKPKK